MIFLSHARADRSIVDLIAAGLVGNQVKVWKDVWNLPPGAALTPSILDAIGRASYFCIVLSKAAVESPWVAMELKAALSSTRVAHRGYLIPLLVETCEIPEEIRDISFIDLREDFEAGMTKLINEVGRKYNVNNSGRLEDGKDYWFDYLISRRLDGDRETTEIDIIASDIEAPYSILAQVRVESEQGSASVPPGAVIRRLIEHHEGKAGTFTVVGDEVFERRFTLPGASAREPALAGRVRVARVGRVPKTVVLFPIRAYLEQIAKDEGIDGPGA